MWSVDSRLKDTSRVSSGQVSLASSSVIIRTSGSVSSGGSSGSTAAAACCSPEHTRKAKALS